MKGTNIMIDKLRKKKIEEKKGKKKEKEKSANNFSNKLETPLFSRFATRSSKIGVVSVQVKKRKKREREREKKR